MMRRRGKARLENIKPKVDAERFDSAPSLGCAPGNQKMRKEAIT